MPSNRVSDMDSSRTATNSHLKFLDKLMMKNSRSKYSLLNKCIAEGVGTMFIVVFGVGAVCNAVVTQTGVDLWHVAAVFGIGVTLAIVMTCDISGAHLNPAVSLAMALFRPAEFGHLELICYWLAQYIGGLLGGAFNLMIFSSAFAQFESDNNITRGSPESIITASAFGEYFPVPGGVLSEGSVSMGTAFLVETWATAILIFVIFAVTDPTMKSKRPYLAPVFIGLTVAILLNLYIPFTQGCLNPARDFGPRLVATMAGWGRVAIPGPRNGFWLYIIAPKLGGVVGAFIYSILIHAGNTDNVDGENKDETAQSLTGSSSLDIEHGQLQDA